MDYKQIPIIINNFNRLTTTKNMVEALLEREYTNIHIIDNNSTYLPLLEWYSNIKDITVFRTINHGNLALWNSGYNSNFKGKLVYTDSDMIIPQEVPEDILGWMEDISNKYLDYPKVGLAFDVEDIPDYFPYKEYIQNHERGHWRDTIELDVYIAAVDTTFAMFDARAKFDYKALRIGGMYTLKHAPYYLDFNNLDEEELYYINSATAISTHSRMYKQDRCS